MMQGIVKQVLEVADNLERAAGAVPEVALSSEDAAELRKQLGMLLEGVQMTQKVLNHVRSLSCGFEVDFQTWPPARIVT